MPRPVDDLGQPGLAYATWGLTRPVRSSFAGELSTGMKVASTLLGTLLGQRPEAAVRPISAAPAPGRAAYRGAKKLPLTAGDRDEKDAVRLAAAVDDDCR